jgi:transposase InsO family protein
MHRRAADAGHGAGGDKAREEDDNDHREFKVTRPNALWVVDFTYVHT